VELANLSCPNNAIYESGVEWRIKDGTSVEGNFQLIDGSSIAVDQKIGPNKSRGVLHCAR